MWAKDIDAGLCVGHTVFVKLETLLYLGPRSNAECVFPYWIAAVHQCGVRPRLPVFITPPRVQILHPDRERLCKLRPLLLMCGDELGPAI